MSDRKNVVPLRSAKDDPQPEKMETSGERWPGQARGGGIPSSAPLPPEAEPYTTQMLPPGYATHPTVRDGMINGWTQPQAPTAIDYLAIRNGITTEAACLLLKDMLEAGRLHAKGPNGPIDAEWWRYGAIRPDGSVDHLTSRLPWFILQAREVLEQLPPPSAWVATLPNATARTHSATTEAQEQPNPTPPEVAPPKEQKRPWNLQEAKALLRMRQRTDLRDAPTVDETRALLKQRFETAPRDPTRTIRGEIWPKDSSRTGPKKKKSAE